ncbi:hypothetical protein AYI68_g1256 [Smittium mucronatum]|uniref:Uncharacterized protein n=1 Tax=Smittium mucronatum TaxID=133383 RepID=A0A1R0H657_9FUNG|nr:hypothetical protein AYI68_g1256 [Smittium mucronatum]
MVLYKGTETFGDMEKGKRDQDLRLLGRYNNFRRNKNSTYGNRQPKDVFKSASIQDKGLNTRGFTTDYEGNNYIEKPSVFHRKFTSDVCRTTSKEAHTKKIIRAEKRDFEKNGFLEIGREYNKRSHQELKVLERPTKGMEHFMFSTGDYRSGNLHKLKWLCMWIVSGSKSYHVLWNSADKQRHIKKNYRPEEMFPINGCLQTHIREFQKARYRFIRNKLQQEKNQLLQLVQGAGGSGTRFISTELEELEEPILVPSVETDSSDIKEDFQRESNSNHSSSIVENCDMVPNS